MNRLTALLDWIDEAAGALIRLAYLAAGVTAVAVYFGAGHLPGPIDAALNNALPWALAFAVETHTYITARRVRAAWQDRQAATRESDERVRADAALRVNLAVLAGLLAFSAWNQLGYLSASGWIPGGSAFALPTWLAYLVRALVVPAAFMAAAFLAPLAAPVSAQVDAEARTVLSDVLRIARRQRRRMLREAERIGRDMTGALVELVPDPEARRIISHAYKAIGAPLGDTSEPAYAGKPSDLAVVTPQGHLLPEPPEKPPTGPGGSNPARPGAERRHSEPALQLVAPASPRRKSRRTASAESRVRHLLEAEPDLTAKQIARRLRISSSTASKYRRLVESERATTAPTDVAQ